MDYKIKKEIIHCGSQYKPISTGDKVFFHFETRLCDESRTLVDDSRTMSKPMELVLGKKFKLEVWETIVQAMAVGEVAKFVVDKSLVTSYPFVSKTLRDSGKPNVQRNHCCGTTLQNQGIGYEDLNQLIKEPKDLQFIIELLKVDRDGDYKKESWQLSEDEKLDAVPTLREEGNKLYRNKDYSAAAEKYALAIGYLDQLLLKEKPHDVEWNELNDKRLPLLLNYAQCKLMEGEYYPVIEHCSTVLQFEPDSLTVHDLVSFALMDIFFADNVKALFRRGRAHGAVWNLKEAKIDLERAAELDTSLRSAARAHLANYAAAARDWDDQDRQLLKGKMF